MSSEPASPPAVELPPRSAGALLRAARQARGVHIAALAAAIKVVPRKLELLESDQFDQLPDPTFTRALAQAVCRSLKIDAAPVLALLPPPKGHRLEHVAGGLNAPFRERPGQLQPKDWAGVPMPVLWGAAVIVLLAGAIYALPSGWLPFQRSAVTRPRADLPEPPPPATAVAPPAPAEAPAASAAASAAVVAASVNEAASAVAPTPLVAGADESAPAGPDPVAAAAAEGVLQVRATALSWVEVTDARGQSLISRLLQPGESVGIDGVAPLKVRVGNALATQVVYRGQPLALAPYTRDNVARLDLK